MKDKGILYGVGVGPGDPQLMTLRAVNIIKDNDIIAVVGKVPCESVAYAIVKEAVADMESKKVIALDMPMSRDEEYIKRKHTENAGIIKAYLKRNKNVVFITLGDVSLYSTFGYLAQQVEKDGFDVEMVSGIPAFVAAAATSGRVLAQGNESVHILTGERFLEEKLKKNDCYVIMKPSGHIEAIKCKIKDEERNACAITRCTMDGETIYSDIDSLPVDAEYFTLIIA